MWKPMAKLPVSSQMNDYDLIILDVMLPRKDGFTICRELRDAG